MAWIAGVYDRLKTAEPATLMFFGAVGFACVVVLVLWAETSRKDIKFWGVEITAPESDAIKACRMIQAAFHEKALGLESERQATYRRIENDEASIDAFTKIELEAKAGSRDSTDYESTVTWRVNNLINDTNSQEKRLEWVIQTEVADTELVNRECGSLL